MAWLLAAASAVLTAYLAGCARRVWTWGQPREILESACIVAVSLVVTTLAVFVAVRASA